MVKHNEIEPQATVSVPTPVGPKRLVRVKVLTGIFKQGQEYSTGEETVMNLFAAENFVRTGDVEILEEVHDEE